MKVVNELLKEVKVMKIEAKEREDKNKELVKKIQMLTEVLVSWVKDIK